MTVLSGARAASARHKRACLYLSAILILAACSQQAAEDRCREAQSLYDADRNAKAAVLTLGACIR